MRKLSYFLINSLLMYSIFGIELQVYAEQQFLNQEKNIDVAKDFIRQRKYQQAIDILTKPGEKNDVEAQCLSY